MISEASERFTKNLWTERKSSQKPKLVSVRDEAEQANYVCQAILAEREAGTVLKSQAVLFRASHHSGPLEIELTRRNIPFVKFGGLKFLDAAHVKDVLAVLRFAENPRDRVAGFRVLQLLPGIGPSAAIADRRGHGDVARRSDGAGPLPAAAARGGGLAGFRCALFRPCAPGQAKWPADLEQVRLWYEPHLERIHEDATTRRADLMQLEQIASGYASRERFLTELTLDPPDATSDQAGPPHRDEDYLILSTIHSAKGQEWKNVFVLNTVDGCIPADLGVGTKEDIEEERRLLYVAMTRAKDSLHLVTPQRFYLARPGGARRPPRLCLAHALHPGLDPRRLRADLVGERPGKGRSAPQTEVRVDLGARMRGMWK